MTSVVGELSGLPMAAKPTDQQTVLLSERTVVSCANSNYSIILSFREEKELEIKFSQTRYSIPFIM